MFCSLIHDTSSYYPYVMYTLHDPIVGNAERSIEELFREKLSLGSQRWPVWATEKYGPSIQTYTFESTAQFQLIYPELFI